MGRATAATWPPTPSSAHVPWPLLACILLTAAVVATATVLRIADDAAGNGGLALNTELLPILFAAGGVCSAALLRRRSPTGAWLAAVIAAGIAAIEVVGLVRARQADAALADWPILATVAELGLVAAAAVAATYAIRGRPETDRSWGRAWWAAGILGLAFVVAAVAWAIAQALGGAGSPGAQVAADIDVWPIRASGRIAAGFIALATIGGALRDLAPMARRAWARSPGPREFPRALGDELLPTSAAMRRRGEEDERARLAADLHARVLPDLRRAAAAAAAQDGGAEAPVSAGLRQAIEDVEHLMHSRQSIVLEEYGLVAALEWLAERTEARSELEVVVELEGPDVDARAAVPAPVARAAFRVALLAVDNVTRHANATRALLRLAVRPDAIELVIADDGRGFDGDTAPSSGRGLIDMRTAANAAGASVSVAASPAGTSIGFRWLRTANHAPGKRDSTGTATTIGDSA